jgi:hypothetical protein
MNHLNPANFAAPQPYLNSMWVKRRIRQKVLDNAARQFSRALVLFEHNGNVCPGRHITSVVSIHDGSRLHSLIRTSFELDITIIDIEIKFILASGGWLARSVLS